ncbi:nucleoporin NUP42-like [Centruroides vittatus]|uniref:nucleoporin NUP42-like n=1 Tax=Centruroides vittatus TaxID=120091 RepID=UPI00350F324E
MDTNKIYFGFKKDEVKIDPNSKFTLILPPGSACKEYQPEELNNIKEDVTAWDQGNMWSFICYCLRNRNCLTCFEDISLEELRWGMIEAKRYATVLPYSPNESNVSSTNFQNTQNVLAPTSFKLPEKNSGTFSSSANGSSDKFSLSNLSRREPFQQIEPANNNQQNIFNSGSSAKSFSFTLAAAETETEMNTFSTDVPSSEVTLLNNFNSKSEQAFGEKSTSSKSKYTEVSQLSKMEKEQFMAPKFVLGMIPTKPPPIELCY